MKTFDLKSYLKKQRAIIDAALKKWLPMEDGPSKPVFDAMQYSLMAGGKRVRPIIFLAGAEAVGADMAGLLPFACAIECIHTYSLIHDDLPAMDNDDLRRGRPTCHKVFGEAVAILAGDGLLTYAFELMTNQALIGHISSESVLRAVSIISKAAGVFGMVGGQTADILMEGRDIDSKTLDFIHRHKTGALIQASVETGGFLGKGTQEEIRQLKRYGMALGLIFQIIDDILDVEGDKTLMGKPIGSDAKKKKATYPALFGVDEARHSVVFLLNNALSCLEAFDEKAEPLRAMAQYVVERDR
ncbi:MAG: polyprenyl synthetase family protein [Desulfobacteraceae bacterium]|nr:polyprenyl synthetase family protein [Desulfobacteraceae bacterium]